MAGPGGGPPRKSHTKSRKGCRTCKKRHIRCDEKFPQCQNCSKHQCRCDYQDLGSPPAPDGVPRSPGGPDLLMNPMIDAQIDNWQRTGIFPFPELGLHNTHQFHGLGKVDLRLIHHLSSVYRDLLHMGLLSCVPWLARLPVFLDVAADNDFVMSSILAFSATDLAWTTKSGETGGLALQHRGTALQGLQPAIGDFSRETSDPTLAATLLLLLQASDWGGWILHMKGITTIMSSMSEWSSDSRLFAYVQNHVIPRPNHLICSMSSLTAPTYGAEDGALQEGIASLQRLYSYAPINSCLHATVEEILQSVLDVQMNLSSMQASGLFEKLGAFRANLLWVPILLLQDKETPDLNLLAIAHLYGLALAIDSTIPELHGAAFGSMVTTAMQEIDQKLQHGLSPQYQRIIDPSQISEMMHFPRRMATNNHPAHRRSFSQTSDTLLSGQQSPYGFQNLHIRSAPHTPNFPPVIPQFSNDSFENLHGPPSPFLHAYPNQSARRHSHILQRSPRPGPLTFERRSFTSSGQHRGESPLYTPAQSPGIFSLENQQGFSFGESSSTGWSGGEYASYDSSDSSNKRSRLS